MGRDVLEGGGGGWDPPYSLGPPMVPTEGGPRVLKRKSSWHRRRRSKILAVSLKHWKGRKGGGGGGPGWDTPRPPAVYGRSNTSLVMGNKGTGPGLCFVILGGGGVKLAPRDFG